MQQNLFPVSLWLATLLLAAALPPFALVLIRRRGKLNSDLRWTAGTILTVCTLIGSIDFWNFCVLTFSKEVPGGWSRLAPLLVQAYAPFFLESVGSVFAGSSVLTLFAAAVLRAGTRVPRG
jgi:hypothetical protein